MSIISEGISTGRRDARPCCAGQLRGIRGRFILSLNDTPEVRELFTGFALEPVGTTYRLSGKATPARKLIVAPP